jgi:hypothetical protein
MAEEFTPEEVERRYVEAMGVELGTIYTHLWNECAWLHWKFHDFVTLYGTSPERMELLNSAAPAFFYQLQGTLWEDILLHVCRLTDPAKQFGKENLTLERLPDLVDAVIRADVESLLASAQQKCAFARDWRNRRITHSDLALSLKKNAVPLASASRKDVREGLDAIAAVLNRVELRYCGGEVGYQYFESSLSARALVYVLERGLKTLKRT